MDIYHCYDPETGIYLCALAASGRPGVLPPDHSTFTAPPKREGFWPVWDGNAWDMIEDHRGKLAYKKDMSGVLRIESLGKIPDGFTPRPPEFSEGYCPVFDEDANAWMLVEDHRGEAGYLDGEYTIIEQIGPVPDGWTTEPPPAPPFVDTRTAEQKREDAYRAEVSPIAQSATTCRAEAEALRRIAGDEEGAAAADAKADELLLELLAKKEDIRRRYPDGE
jgi:hypothetical protein